MNILGISCYFHDAAAVLLRDGLLVAAAEEERFTRRKHDPSFPEQAIAFCLRQAQIAPEEVDYVVFFEKPLLKLERLLSSSLQYFPRSLPVFREAMITWLGDKLWVKARIHSTLGIEANRILFSGHHLSHAASAFLCSPFERAAIVTVDGVGEWATATIGRGEGLDIEILEEIRYPHSLGLLYSAFTAFLGFEVNDGEYKVMGMAPFGRPRYVDRVRKVVHTSSDGSFELDLDYFEFQRSIRRTYSSKFESLFGLPRDAETPFFTKTTGVPAYFEVRTADLDSLSERNQHYADIAASIQVVVEEILLAMVRRAKEKTALEALCLAGGVALNAAANGRIAREGPFRDLYIQPAAGDSGGALGAALWAQHTILRQPRSFVMDHVYWGEEQSDAVVATWLRANGVAAREVDSQEVLTATVVDHLLRGHVVGWSRGRFEWGPRALGNRSILADPRRTDMKDIVNTKIKFREPFRPFAPSVLAESSHEFFAEPCSPSMMPTRFMLCVAPVREEKREAIPAVTHVDNSARLQTVDRSANPSYHALIQTFASATGVPVLLNTSFNLRGEPIVNHIAEAFSTFQRSGIDVLVAGRFIVEKE